MRCYFPYANIDILPSLNNNAISKTLVAMIIYPNNTTTKSSPLALLVGIICYLYVLLSPIQAANNKQADENNLPTINILADRALTIPLTQLASDYSKTHKAAVAVTFAPSFEQALAIEEGEPANLFISAHSDSLQQLQQQGLFDVYSLTPIIKGSMALITSTSYPDNIATISIDALQQMRQQPNFLLAIANPAATAEGYYTAQILDKVRSKISLAGNLVQLQNTEDILEFMRKTPSFGIIFESDALQQTDLTMLGIFPNNWHQKPIFTAAVVAGKEMEAARSFLRFLTTAKAQRHFIRYGFSPVSDKKNN